MMNIRELVRNLLKLFLIIAYSNIFFILINKKFPDLFPNQNILYFIYYAYMFITLFIISWKFGNYIENLFFYYLNSLISYLYTSIMCIVCIALLFIITNSTSLYEQYLNLIFNFLGDNNTDYLLIIFIILFPLSALLNKTRLMRIEFKMLNNNFENFTKRQKWMTKIFKRLTKKLERGNIKVSHDDLLSHFNLKSMPYEYIIDIENWMINEKNDADFFYSLKQIIPEEDIKSIEKISYRNIIFRIFEPEYFKYLWIPLILIYLEQYLSNR